MGDYIDSGVGNGRFAMPFVQLQVTLESAGFLDFNYSVNQPSSDFAYV